MIGYPAEPTGGQFEIEKKKTEKKNTNNSRSFSIMPYCRFCGKLCSTGGGLNRHIDTTPSCKKASREEFSKYANSIWEDVPENLNNLERQPLLNHPMIDPDLPDFHLEEDIQTAEELISREEHDVPPQQDPLPHPQHATMPMGDVPDKGDAINGYRYIENFPEEFLAGATWGKCKPLFKRLDEERKRVGGRHWAPFEDEEEWQLAEWLIRDVGQKQTDIFLKLPIVSFSLPLCQSF